MPVATWWSRVPPFIPWISERERKTENLWSKEKAVLYLAEAIPARPQDELAK
jgi:hypothetical protein